MDEQKSRQQHLIPAAILLTGIIIAFSIYYSNGNTDRNPTLTEKNQETAGNFANKTVADVLTLKNDDFVLGNPNTVNTIIEYGDFQCPFCGRFYSTTEQELKEKYVKTGKAKFVWRDFAFLGEESLWASEAARCAGDQEKFWQYHDYLFENQKGENQGAFSKDNLKKFAKNLGLNTADFNQCLDSGKYKQVTEDQTKEGRDLGINGTPTTFINGEIIVGAQPFSVFGDLIK